MVQVGIGGRDGEGRLMNERKRKEKIKSEFYGFPERIKGWDSRTLTGRRGRKSG